MKMDDVMDAVVKTINFIKGGHNAKNHRLFKNFLNEFGAEFNDVVMFTNVRWLSRGNSLSRFFELRIEILTFLKINNKDTKELQAILEQKSFLKDLAFLNDIFALINTVNKKLQGEKCLIFEMVGVIDGFKKQLQTLIIDLDNSKIEMFPSISKISSKVSYESSDFEKYRGIINNSIA